MTSKQELKPLLIVETEKCLNCRFVGDDVVRGYKALVCRRYAPRFISGVGTGETSQLFPLTWGDNWCGEWEIDKQMRFMQTQKEKDE